MDKFLIIHIGLLIISILYRLFPPANINFLYGYRTKRSMKSQDTWNESNRYAANAMILLAAIGITLVLISRYMIDFPMGERYSGLLMIIGLVAIIPIVEIHLHTNFDKDGRWKKRESKFNEQ